ncbi:YgaP family membrane protein [Mesoflavibacter profundi]
MGALDKSLRVLTAIIIAILYFLNVIEGTIAYILMVIAIIFLITSFINFCPIYSLIGINTCRKK